MGPYNPTLNNSRVNALLSQVPLVDGHNDFAYILRGWYGLGIKAVDIENMSVGQTDLVHLKQGRLGGQFWSAFVPRAKDQGEESALRMLRDTLQQIDLIHQMVEMNPHALALAGSADEVWQIFRSGRIASLIGVEGLHQVGGSFSALRMFHRLGVRYITLSHDGHNDYTDSSTPASPRHGGLSAQGIEMILEMNRTGIIVDLSHTSTEAQRQALKVSEAPVIFSHSCCHALQPHARNVADDTLQALKANGGVIMICFLPSLSGVSGSGKPASVATVAEHVMHVGQTIGFQHVGIGSDFDGMLEGPEGLDTVSAYPALVGELLHRNIPERDILGVLGLNILRVLDEVGVYAAQQQRIKRPRAADAIGAVWTDAQREMLARKGRQRRGE